MTLEDAFLPRVTYRERTAVAEASNVLSLAECEALIALGVTDMSMWEAGLFDHEKGGTAYSDVRKSRIAWLHMPEDPAIQRVFDTISEINQQMFKFRLEATSDLGLQFTIYEPGGHYAWHRDWNVTQLANRKLSAVIQLSDPNLYGGGGLQVYVGHDDAAYEAPRAQGSMLVFPSFMMHRVIPVDWGTRYSLVIWVTGPNLS